VQVCDMEAQIGSFIGVWHPEEGGNTEQNRVLRFGAASAR